MKTKLKILRIFGNYFNWDNIAYIDIDNKKYVCKNCGKIEYE